MPGTESVAKEIYVSAASDRCGPPDVPLPPSGVTTVRMTAPLAKSAPLPDSWNRTTWAVPASARRSETSITPAAVSCQRSRLV